MRIRLGSSQDCRKQCGRYRLKNFILGTLFAVIFAAFNQVAQAKDSKFNGCEPSRGTICQGAGCPTANPSDALTFNNMTSENIVFSVTNLGPNTPCGIHFDRQQGNGVFNGSSFVVNNTAQGDLNGLIFPGPAKTVTYQTAASDLNQTVKIKIGPPTGQNNSNACNPQNMPESFSYEVTCVPTTGNLEIKKVSIGGVGPFEIDASPSGGGAAVDFDIATTSPGVEKSLSKVVATGQYTISEVAPSGWLLDSIVCDGTGSATANVSINTTTTCVVTNRKKASVTIKKETSGGLGKFTFNSSSVPAGQAAIGPFEQDTTNANPSAGEQLTNLVPGTYSLIETLPAVRLGH